MNTRTLRSAWPRLVFVAALILSLHVAASRARAADSARPNILFIIFDDWGWQHAGAYGSTWVKTPNFDRVAREGVLFRHAFVSAPSCTPSRSALLSGQHFWRTGRGAILTGAVWDGSNLSWPLILKSPDKT